MRGKLQALLCLLLAACVAQETGKRTEEVSVRALAAGLQCGKGEAAAVVELASGEASDARYFALLPQDLASALKVERVFVVSMGLHPTAGYSVGLAQARARLERGVVMIPVVWHEPARGAITAQVITWPCLIVALEKRRYAGVKVVDQNGIERAQLGINE
jgi:PrcB C-terminal